MRKTMFSQCGQQPLLESKLAAACTPCPATCSSIAASLVATQTTLSSSSHQQAAATVISSAVAQLLPSSSSSLQPMANSSCSRDAAIQSFFQSELKLDASQVECAVFDPNQPLIILAGAGSGKTQTIAARIAFLVLSGIAPDRILALSFTRQSCLELRDRIQVILNTSARCLPDPHASSTSAAPMRPVMPRTLHSFGLFVLRTFCDENVDVIDQREQRKIVLQIVSTSDAIRRGAANHGISELVGSVLKFVDEAKNKGKRPGSAKEPSPDVAARSPVEYIAYFYEKYLRDNGLVDFGDLQMRFLEALRVLPSSAGGGSTEKSLAQKLRAKYTHIIVDEFQDLNEVQFNIVCSLCGDACRITAVGDPNQAIFEWRGAMPDIFRKFCQRFDPSSKEAFVREKALGVNYRSVPRIVEAGSAVALNKVQQVPHRAATEAKIHHFVTTGGMHDLDDLLVKVIRDLVVAPPPGQSTARAAGRGGYSFGDICVLVRSGVRGMTVRRALASGRIPYRYLRRTDATVRDDMKKLIAALRLAASGADRQDQLVFRALELYMNSADLFRFKTVLGDERRNPTLHAWSPPSSSSIASHTHISAMQLLERLLVIKKSPLAGRGLLARPSCPHAAPDIDPTQVLPKSQVKLRELAKLVRGVEEMLSDDEKSLEDILDFACEEKKTNVPIGQKRARSGLDDMSEAADVSAEERQRLINNNIPAAAHCEDDDEVADAIDGSIRTFFGEALAIVNLTSSTVEELQQMRVSSSDFSVLQHTKSMKLHQVLDDMLNLTKTDDYGGGSSGRSENMNGTNHGKVVVSTVHGAKGLEWPVVIVFECNMGHFPPGPPKEFRAEESFRIKREEHRVFYVAVTRARDELYLIGHRLDDVTPFVEQLPQELVAHKLISVADQK